MSVKPRTNLILDTIILVVFFVALVSGLLLEFVYPHGGTRAGRGRGADVTTTSTTEILTLDHAEMGTVHTWSSIIVGVLVTLHLVFHLKWLFCQYKRLLRPRQAQTPLSRSPSCPE